MTITADRLRELLYYDPATGIFRWRVRMGQRGCVGAVAGSREAKGYWRIKIDGKPHKAHRLAWLYIHGVWPSDQIDHRNGDRADNRLSNLRPASNGQNQANVRRQSNNVSGLKGVRWHRANQNWNARITVNRKSIFLGRFATAAEAHSAYCSAAERLFGEFARAE
jgi:HNH endonuclease